jgi:hypothetical protein
MGWLRYLYLLPRLAQLIAEAKLLYPGKPIRTMFIVENPGFLLEVETAQALLESTRATVLPGFQVIP